MLPKTTEIKPSGTGESPLANIEDWVNVTDPETGMKGRRETNTMPQRAGSSWYYLRFIDPHNSEKLADEDLLKEWLPVDIYIGGAEDRKSTRLNSSHVAISYAVFCLKKEMNQVGTRSGAVIFVGQSI